ncbi:MAG: hypothetical protein CM15mP65_09760 [Crocinitomicaceae bacterium]|nr:MAG: hypothetical protein CM15mP65_09760 [Crocinitomicaceae bacterium]
MFRSVLLYITVIFLNLIQFQAQSVNGKVLDKETESAIPYAKIYCLETQNGVIADSTGKWQLDNLINNQMTLQISAQIMETRWLKLMLRAEI